MATYKMKLRLNPYITLLGGRGTTAASRGRMLEGTPDTAGTTELQS